MRYRELVIETAPMTAIHWLHTDPEQVSRLLHIPIEVVQVAQSKLLPLVKNGHIECWRAMKLRHVNDLYPEDRIGSCFTFIQHLAIPYDAGKSGQLYRFHVSIPASSVDWAETMALWGSDEHEIRMIDGRPLTLLGIDQLDSKDRVVEPNCRPDMIGATMQSGPAV